MQKPGSAALRRAFEAHVGGRGRRYDGALMERARDFAEQRRREGRSWQSVANELCVRVETLRRWCVGCEPGASRPSVVRLRPVEVVAEPATRELSVVSRSGLRVEGVTLEDVVALLRAVG